MEAKVELFISMPTAYSGTPSIVCSTLFIFCTKKNISYNKVKQFDDQLMLPGIKMKPALLCVDFQSMEMTTKVFPPPLLQKKKSTKMHAEILFLINKRG